MSSIKKVIIINNIISPLRVFLYNNLNKYYIKKDWEFKVIFLSETDKNRNWKKDTNIEFEFEILNNFAIRTYEKDLNTFFINTKIFKALNRENPDKIICFGWDHFSAYASNWWSRKNKKEFILWSGSTKYEKSWRRTLFSPLVKYLIKKSNGFITYGTRAKEYLTLLGAPEENIKIFYNTIDIDLFNENIQSFTDEQKQELRDELGIKTRRIIIFSGRLIEMKGIFEMIKAFKLYTKKDPDISLIIMGTGPDKDKLKEIVKKEKISNIFLVGFIQYEELYKYYGISDLLLFPSRQDIWGLVINEAMACGLPIITTKEVGASKDLILPNENGYIIKSNNSQEIAIAIKNIFRNNLHKKNNSLEIIKKTKIANNLINPNLL